MTTMHGIHNSDTCTADHGQPCAECARRRDGQRRCVKCGDEKRWLRSDGTCGYAYTSSTEPFFSVCGCTCEHPAPDPFPLESPPLRSLSEGAADDDELADPDPIDHGSVSPELLAVGHALIIQQFDEEWAKADERYKRDRHSAFH